MFLSCSWWRMRFENCAFLCFCIWDIIRTWSCIICNLFWWWILSFYLWRVRIIFQINIVLPWSNRVIIAYSVFFWTSGEAPTTSSGRFPNLLIAAWPRLQTFIQFTSKFRTGSKPIKSLIIFLCSSFILFLPKVVNRSWRCFNKGNLTTIAKRRSSFFIHKTRNL